MRTPRRRGPSCLATLGLLLLAFVLGMSFAYRNEVATALRPEPSPTPTQSPASHATRARLYERDREFDKAIEAWEEALRLDPNNPVYTSSLMTLLVRAGEPERAIRLGVAVVESTPDNDALWTALAAAYIANGVRRENLGLIQEQDYGLAVEAGRSAVAINPSNALAYAYMAGGMLRQGGNFVITAQGMIDNAVALLPRLPTSPQDAQLTNRDREMIGIVRYYTGEILSIQGYYDSARQQYEMAIEADPNMIPAYLSLSRIYYFVLQEQQRGIITIRGAIERDPTNADLYDALSFFNIIAGAYPEAEQNARQAIRYNNDMVRAHARLGHAYFGQNNYPNAITHLEIATQRYGSPSPTTALYFALLGLAYYYEDSNQCPQAQVLFENVLKVAAKGSPAELSALQGQDFCRQVQLTRP